MKALIFILSIVALNAYATEPIECLSQEKYASEIKQSEIGLNNINQAIAASSDAPELKELFKAFTAQSNYRLSLILEKLGCKK